MYVTNETLTQQEVNALTPSQLREVKELAQSNIRTEANRRKIRELSDFELSRAIVNVDVAEEILARRASAQRTLRLLG